MISSAFIPSDKRSKPTIELSRTYGDGAGFAEFYSRDYVVTVLDEDYSTIDGVATIYEPKVAQALDVLIFAFERATKS